MAADDMQLHGRQFMKQELMRTITLGFSPFIPFSREYVMKLNQQGRKDEGFFDMVPQSTGKDGSSQVGANWFDRRTAYENTLEGKPRVTLGAAKNVATKQDTLAMKLNRMLDGELTYKNESFVRQTESSVIGEILTELGTQELRKLGFGESSEYNVTRESINKLSSQGFDVLRNAQTEPLFNALSTLSKKGFMDDVVAIEETETKLKKELQAGLKGKGDADAIKQVQSNIKSWFGKNGKINKELSQYQGLNPANFKAARDDSTDAFIRQILDRSFQLTANSAMLGKSAAYTFPVGDTGIMAMLKLATTTNKTNSPQVTVVGAEYVKVGGHGRLIEAMGVAAGTRQLEQGGTLIENMGEMNERSYAEAMATQFRSKMIGAVQQTTVEQQMDPDAFMEMVTKGPGLMGLTSTDIAKNIKEQITQAVNGGKMKGAFKELYLQMIREANRASEVWKKKVLNSSSYLYSTNQSAGVWSDDNTSWDPETSPKYGLDYSISPFLISRRKGVASFKSENKASFIKGTY